MRQSQLANIIVTVILLISSSAGLIGVGFSQIKETIRFGSDDGYPFIGLLAVVIILVFYLINAVRFYLRKTAPNNCILWSCGLNISIVFFIFLAIMLALISGDGMAVFFIAAILAFIVVSLTILSFILFMIGKRISKINVN